jgi:hypothetical protein
MQATFVAVKLNLQAFKVSAKYDKVQITMKKYKVSLITLIFALLVALFALTLTTSASVYAADNLRTVSVTNTNIFYASVGSANLSPVKETYTSGDTSTSKYYIGFSLSDDDDLITFRRNLAYSWWSQTTDSQNGTTVANNKFTMTIGFKSEYLNFEKYTIKFQSQQYNKTKANVSTNYIMFAPTADKTGVNVVISDSEDAKVEPDYTLSITNNNRITISFGEYKADGVYEVTVSDGTGAEGHTYVGDFENVFETYAKYVSSGTSACTPLSFSATFAEDADDD